MRCEPNHVGAHVRVVGAGIYVVEMRDVDTENDRADNDQHADNAAGNPHTKALLRRCGSVMAGTVRVGTARGALGIGASDGGYCCGGDCGSGTGKSPQTRLKKIR